MHTLQVPLLDPFWISIDCCQESVVQLWEDTPTPATFNSTVFSPAPVPPVNLKPCGGICRVEEGTGPTEQV